MSAQESSLAAGLPAISVSPSQGKLLSRPGSIIVVDNVVRDGRVIDSESDEPDIQGVRRFLEMVGANATVSGTDEQSRS